MREQFDDYEKKIMEKIDREAEEIQCALEMSPQITDVKPDQSLDQKVCDRIEAYEDAAAKRNTACEDSIPAGLSEKDAEAIRLGRELQKRRAEKERRKAARKSMGMWKRMAAAVLALVLAAGVGVNSLGGPERVVEMVTSSFGGREVSKINSSEDDVKNDDREEEQAYQQIKNELGIDPVRIIHLLEKMKYKYCEVDADLRVAQFLYEYEDRNISYLITDSYTEELWGTDIEDRVTDEYPYISGELDAEITEYELPDSKAKRYSAEFEYNGVFYQLTATMKWEKFKEILNNLHFPT